MSSPQAEFATGITICHTFVAVCLSPTLVCLLPAVACFLPALDDVGSGVGGVSLGGCGSTVRSICISDCLKLGPIRDFGIAIVVRSKRSLPASGGCGGNSMENTIG